MDLVSVVVPTYNEEEAIGEEIDRIQAAMQGANIPYELIIVNDGSTDRTREIVLSKPGVQLVDHVHNRGTGAARTTGTKLAQGEIVVMTDGDLTYPSYDMPRLIEAMNGNDMVIGARVREMGTMKWLRTPAKWFIRRLASYLTGVEIPDLNSGFRAFRKDAVLKYINILPNTHSWVSTITIAFLSDDRPVKWIPIEYYARAGRSSFHPVRDTYNYATLVVRAVMYFNPLKVFLPLSAFLLAFGGIKLIRDLIVFNLHVPASTVLVLLSAVQLGAMGLLADLIVRKTKDN